MSMSEPSCAVAGAADDALSPPDSLGALSQFRHGAEDRRLLERARLEATQRTAHEADDKPWGLLYRALVDSIGLSPDDFQMLYPSVPWDWPRTQAGFIHPAQYDFCATAPQWGAIGAYVSSGDTVDQAYQQCLNVVPAQTAYPSLAQHLRDADDALVAAANLYTLATTSAAAAHSRLDGEPRPGFTAWLGSAGGRGYQARILAASTAMRQAQAHYAALVAQCDDPALGAAQRRCGRAEHHARLADLDLLRLAPVPDWRVAEAAADWVARVEGGRGPGAVTLGFSQREAPYDFSQTWAGQQARVRRAFWQVRVDGRWEAIDEFEFDPKLELSLDFQAVQTVAIRPGGWYDGDYVRSLIDGPFVAGYSAFGENGTQAVFGERGFFGLVKTGLCVGYRPSFAIRASASVFRRFAEAFAGASGLRIGPLTLHAEGGSQRAGWRADPATHSFSGACTGRTPSIIGATVAEWPNGPR